MKKKPFFKSNLKNSLTTILVGLIFCFFGWVTQQVNVTQLPEQSGSTHIYASENNDDLRRLFSSAIDSAQESITLLVYSFTDESIIQALRNKAKKGVNVEVIVDAKASPHIAQRLGPDITTLRRAGAGLMHCKWLVIDKKLTLVGSANMTGDSLRTHSNLVLGINHEALAQFVTAKAKSLKESGKGPFFPIQNFQVGGQNIELWFLPDNAPLALTRLKSLMRASQKTIRVAMFTWTRRDFAHELVRAAKRGVKVQAVIDRTSGMGVSAQTVQFLKNNDIDVRLSNGVGLLHHKFMTIDGRTLVNGSANWTKAAFGSNDDSFIVVEDLTEKQKEKLEDEWSVLYADSNAA